MVISIIIITLNEIENIEKTIEMAKNSAKMSSGSVIPIEIIVSDGGSEDGTIEIAKELADKVVIGPRGRYLQLNTGAKLAEADILLFLHADTLLPKGAILRIVHQLKDPNLIGGGFKKNWNWKPYVKRSSFLKFMNYFWEAMGNWLVRVFKSFPGDNAIFVRKNVFDEIKGFKPLWICEDFDFSRRLKKYGKHRIIYFPFPVLTSTRRFEKYGFFKVVFMWHLIYFLWRLGMSANRLRVRFNKYSTVPEKGDKEYLRF
ncbi:MAG: glycosyltransferase [Promethearchaeota archaeon]|nr:MAG: glycosyltransferase [Candidatus Lokiarchaeota archaeon]